MKPITVMNSYYASSRNIIEYWYQYWSPLYFIFSDREVTMIALRWQCRSTNIDSVFCWSTHQILLFSPADDDLVSWEWYSPLFWMMDNVSLFLCSIIISENSSARVCWDPTQCASCRNCASLTKQMIIKCFSATKMRTSGSTCSYCGRTMYPCPLR